LGGAVLIIEAGWHWFSLTEERPPDALVSAPVLDLERCPAGFLTAWPRSRHRPPGALGIDARAVDPAGPPAWVSLALAGSKVRLRFDDVAVIEAMRAVLRRPPAVAVSTLSLDASTIGGALTAAHDPQSPALLENPFKRLFPVRLLRVGEGFVGSMTAPAGPVVQRYVGAPWPWDRFPG
jgi:hypothetical protein